MGKTLCTTHGFGWSVEACAHVADYIDRSEFPDYVPIHFIHGLLLCPTCVQDFGFEPFRSMSATWDDLGDELADQLHEQYAEARERLVGTRGFCSLCVSAAKVAQARKDGLPDPFPVYENTVNSDTSDVFLEIRQLIFKNFAFRRSIIDKKRLAAYLSPGLYLSPLSFCTYYMRDRQEQDRLVDLIRRCLNKPPFYQARITFWDAEAWTTVVTGNYQTSTRGKETMLREEYINCT